MLNFLERLPNIYLVLLASILLLVAYLVTREQGMFQLLTTTIGALTGLAMRTSKTSQTINADKVENLENSITESEETPIFHREK